MPRAYVPDLHGGVRIPVTLTQSILHHGECVSAILDNTRTVGIPSKCISMKLGHTSTARLLGIEPTSYVLWFHIPKQPETLCA